MSTITWLHLSDLHFRESQAYKANIVLEALLRDISGLISSQSLRPHFIICTGDIAYAGKPDEYRLAQQFFDGLRKTTRLPKKRLFVIPGNHDVDRGAISPGALAIGERIIRARSTQEYLAWAEDHKLIFQRFHNYAAFVNSYFANCLSFDTDENYFYVKVFKCKGKRVAVLGLNSAWLSASDRDERNLAIGEIQVRSALDRVGKVDLCIAAMHHPFAELALFDQDECEPLLTKRCNFILHGHWHRTGIQRLITPDSGAMIIAGGACYETSTYPNTYNFVRLDLDDSRGMIVLRRYSPERGGFWAADNLTYENVLNGMYIFPLPKELCPPEFHLGGPTHVLIVDDEKDWFPILKGHVEDALTAVGEQPHVQLAENAKEARNMLDKLAFRLAVIDIYLTQEELSLRAEVAPPPSGKELFDLLINAGVPVIVVTGHPEKPAVRTIIADIAVSRGMEDRPYLDIFFKQNFHAEERRFVLAVIAAARSGVFRKKARRMQPL